jgi:hypothetical protein
MRIEYILLGLTCMFLLTNFLGLGFTLHRLRHAHESRDSRERAKALW